MQWYHEEIERLARKPVAAPVSGRLKAVFYGSSTFTHWPDLAQAFPQVQSVNLGFGGSTLAACAWFFKTVVPAHRPDLLLLYAGDNDLGDGRTPEEVVLFYEHLLNTIAGSLGEIPVCFISIKPSPARQHLRSSIEYANRCISQRVAANGPPRYFLDLYSRMLDDQGHPQRALFAADGLHLSPKGYDLWQHEISAQLNQMLPQKPMALL